MAQKITIEAANAMLRLDSQERVGEAAHGDLILFGIEHGEAHVWCFRPDAIDERAELRLELGLGDAMWFEVSAETVTWG